MSGQWREISRLMLHSSQAERADSNRNASGVTCGRGSCLCTHRGCTAGWIDQTRDDGLPIGKEVAIPCPTCHPKLSEHLRRGGTPDSWRNETHRDR